MLGPMFNYNGVYNPLASPSYPFANITHLSHELGTNVFGMFFKITNVLLRWFMEGEITMLVLVMVLVSKVGMGGIYASLVS